MLVSRCSAPYAADASPEEKQLIEQGMTATDELDVAASRYIAVTTIIIGCFKSQRGVFAPENQI